MAATQEESSTNLENASCLKFTFTWTIDNFQQHCRNKIRSNTFSAGFKNVTEWRFIALPTDTNPLDYSFVASKLFISVLLEMISGNPFSGELKFSCIDNQNCDVTDSMPISVGKFECSKTYGHTHFLECRKVLDPAQHILSKSGSLTIRCTLIYEEAETTSYLANAGQQIQLSVSMENSIGSEKFSDVEIVARGSKIPAHKVILCSRSQHFANMFEHDTLEKRTNCVELDMDVETARELLRYIYSGRTNPLSLELAEELFIAADKYLLDELKSMCVESLLQHLSMESAFRILSLADKYDQKLLKIPALNLIASNVESVIQSNEWYEFVTLHPHLTTAIIKGALNNTKPHVAMLHRCKKCGYSPPI